MANKYYIAWNTTALVAATPKTILELPTVANTMLDACELVVGCDASTAGSMLIEQGTFTTTGTGTAATPQKYRGNPNIDSSITAAKIKDTVEPTTFTNGTAGALLWPSLLVPLPMYYIFQWPLGAEHHIVESLNWGIRLTASINCNTAGWFAWVE